MHSIHIQKVAMSSSPTPQAPAKISFGLSPALIVTLASLTAIGPLGIDMYLASIPQIATDLNTSAAAAQMTLSAFMLGMALGQFVIGPLSDKTGRRVPILIGSVVCFAATALCAFSPNIEVFIAARFIMGFSGAAGSVLARSIVADTTTGLATAKLMGIMMMINGFAPVLAPLFGGWILSWGTWRTVFNVLTVVTALLMLAVLFFVRETLPVERRLSGSVLHAYSGVPVVLKKRRYVGFMLTMSFAFGALFSYISGSTFVLQNVLGMDPGQFTIVFGINSFGIVAMSSLATNLVGKVGQRTVLNVGVSSLLVVASLLVASFSFGINYWVTLVLLFALTCSVGLIFGNSSALAIAEAREVAGSASAVMGTIQALIGGIAAPLVSVGGEHAYMPMGISILGFAALTALMLWTTPRLSSDFSADGK